MNALYVEFKPTDADIQEIKTLAGIPSSETKHDEYIAVILPMLMEAVMTETNNNFGILADGTLRIPGGVKIYLSKAIQRNLRDSTIKSRSMGSVSYTYDTAVPKELLNLLTPYKKVKFHASR